MRDAMCNEEGFREHFLEPLEKSQAAIKEMVRLSRAGRADAKVFHHTIGEIGGWLQKAAGYVRPWKDDC